MRGNHGRAGYITGNISAGVQTDSLSKEPQLGLVPCTNHDGSAVLCTSQLCGTHPAVAGVVLHCGLNQLQTFWALGEKVLVMSLELLEELVLRDKFPQDAPSSPCLFGLDWLGQEVIVTS